MKRFAIIFGIVLASLYVIFLLSPLVLSPILNSYNAKISSMIEDASGFKVKFEKLGIVTTPKLSAGIKAGKAQFMLPNGETFLAVDDFKGKISLLPLIIGKIELDSISADILNADLKVRPDGHFLLEEFIPKSESTEQSQSAPMPSWIKLSNKLPDISVKNYDITFVDMPTSKEYSITGNKFKISDFVLDKKIKVSANGAVTFDNLRQFTYDIKVFNKLMPDLSLNDMVFNPEPAGENTQTTSFNITDLFKALNKTELSADISANLKTGGTFEDVKIDGTADVENISMLVDGKKLPASFVKINAKGNKIKLNSSLYSAENEKTVLTGKFKTGKSVDMHFTSNAQFNNLFRILNSFAKSFNYNDLETLSATGALDADFNIKSASKHITSDGHLKVDNASINYGLYNIAIKNIKADVDFNNKLDIKNIGLDIMGQPLKIYGTILENTDTDVHVTADKLLLKGLVATAGQLQLLKENSFASGTLSLDAALKGKFDKLSPAVNLLVNNLDVTNLPSKTRVTMPEAKFTVKTDGKKFNGDLNILSLRAVNPLATISVPEAQVLIGEKNIDIQKAYLLVNNSRIDVTGKITDYVSDKLKLDINAEGALLANDIKSIFPKELQVKGAGKIPLKVKISGDMKAQDILFNLTANPSNYISVLDIDVLKGKNTIINSNVRIADDSAKLTQTGVYANDLTNPVAKLEGSVSNLSKSQTLALRLSLPKRLNMAVPGFNKSNLGIRGDIDISGTAQNPYLKGLINIPEVSLPDMALTVTNLVANLNGPVLKGNATVQEFKSGGIAAQNIASEFALKNYSVFYLNNLAGDAFDGKISGRVSYGINDGKIKVNLTGSNMNALKAIEGAAGIKNALSGTLGFNADIQTHGATDVDIMKYLTGKVSFDINNGKLLNLGRFDSLLYAQNILGNAILKAAVTSVTNLPIIQNTAEFKNIKGDLTFNGGWANISSITTSGPYMAYYIKGKYNLLNGTTNVIVLGRLDSKVVAVLGPLGDLSVDKLTSYIPKFGALTSVLINSVTSDPAKENTANIPALSSGSTSYKDFKVEFNGGLESKSSIKSFKWLTKCDTSAIDLKEEFNSAKEDIKNAVQDAKQNLQDKKQQLLDAKDELKNLFKF